MRKIIKHWPISLLAVLILAFYMLIYWQKLNDFAEFVSFTIFPNEEKCVHYYGINTVADDSDTGWDAVLTSCHVLYSKKIGKDYWRERYAECILKEFKKKDIEDIPESFSILAIQKCRYEIAKEKRAAKHFADFQKGTEFENLTEPQQ